MRKRMVVAVALVGVALVAAGCSSGEGHGASGSSTAVEVPADAPFNEADVSFAQGMIPHHEQAVEMAEMALANTTTPAVVELATRIRDGQDPEIQTMQGWLKAWGQPVGMGMAEGHGGMDGMMSDEDMSKLMAAMGPEFDAMFLEMMIEHHQGAIAMAEDVRASGKIAATKSLADAIIAAQQAEIAEMRALVDHG